jgi:hypothetical protein
LRTVAAVSRQHRLQAVEYPSMLAAWLIDRQWPAERHAAHKPTSDAMNRLHGAMKELVDMSADVVNRWRAALCLGNEHRDALKITLSLLPLALDWRALPVAQRKRLLARSQWPLVWAVVRGLCWWPGVKDFIAQMNIETCALFNEGVAPTPLITGDDLVAMGMKPGRELGKLLDSVYDAQLEKRITTAEEAMAMARLSM